MYICYDCVVLYRVKEILLEDVNVTFGQEDLVILTVVVAINLLLYEI